MSAASTSELRCADEKAIASFVDAMFRYADDGSYISLRGFLDVENGPPFKIQATSIGSNLIGVTKVAFGLATECARHSKPVVFCPPLATFSNPRKATEADLQNGIALSVECDARPSEARIRLENLLGPATMVVESGGRWTDPATGEIQAKLHLHWRLNEPTRDADSHRLLKRARIMATSLVGGDASNKPIVHPIRWPGSWHCKATPRLSTIRASSEHEINLTDALEVLEAATIAGGNTAFSGGKSEQPQTEGEERATAELIGVILGAADFHAPLIALAMRFLKGGMADAQVVETLRGLMLAVPLALRDLKDGTPCPGRWQARYDGIPRAVTSARAKLGEKPAAASAPSLEVFTPDQCETRLARAYVIKGILSEGDHAGLIGQPGSGKSLLGPYLGYAIAQGREAFNLRSKKGPVLYIAAEDGHGMTLRVRALRRRFGEAPSFYLMPQAVDLRDPNCPHLGQVQELVLRIRPAVIFLDTLARCFPGLKENEAEDMSRVVTIARGLSALIPERPPSTVTMHHVAKDAGTTPRGHGSLNGDMDVVLFVEGAGGEPRRVSLGKNRSGPSDRTFAFTVATECLDTDADGDPILAPLAEEPSDGAAKPVNSAKERKLADQHAVLLRELRNLLADQGELHAPGEGYPTVRAVTRDLLRKRLLDRGWFAENLLRDASQGGGLLREAYTVESRSLTTLKRNAFISYNRDWVWAL